MDNASSSELSNAETIVVWSGAEIVVFAIERTGTIDFGEAFTSNFARDPTTRVEFLTEYLRRVRIFKQLEEHTDDKKGNLCLWRFLSLLAASGLFGEMEHLIIETYKNVLSLRRPPSQQAWWDAPLGHIFAVLFHFRVKCELTFIRGPPAYKPILDRIMEIVKTDLSRDKIEKYYTSSCFEPYHYNYFSETHELFSEDTVLLELIDRFEQMSEDEKKTNRKHVDDHHLLKYAIEFSK